MEKENSFSNSTVPHMMFSISFGIIALVATFENGVIALAMLRGGCCLKSSSSCDFLYFTLAISDFLIGLTVAITPGYIIVVKSYPVPSGAAGGLFCRLLGTEYFVWAFGKVSVLTTAALALKRWYSVVYPIQYRLKFTRQRVYVCTSIIWLLSLLLNVNKVLKLKFDNSTVTCSCTGSTYIDKILIPTNTVSFFITIIIIWMSFFHLRSALQESPSRNNNLFCKTEMKLRKVCTAAAVSVTTFWLPIQVMDTLSIFKIARTESPVHRSTVVLAMFNSCVNPWLYSCTNKQYVRSLKSLFGLPGVKQQAAHKCDFQQRS